MIIFGMIWTTFESISTFEGSWGSIENWLEPKTEQPSGNLAKSVNLSLIACWPLGFNFINILLERLPYKKQIWQLFFNYSLALWLFNKRLLAEKGLWNVDEIDNRASPTTHINIQLPWSSSRPGVNFINVKRTNFSYERCSGSFY